MSYEISFKEGLPYDCTCAVCEQVQSLLVKCPFVRFGCEWTGPLKEMQKHAENCDWQGVPCSNCNKLIAQRELNSHLSECQKTRGKCSYCNMMVKTASMEKHLKVMR
ncbi:hypothetical protein Q1695_014028 [Nippostrongylus brasiliensis]|nr:hypothetical protein Q1695_014028 [Nippostrongylus brasiliensis]